MCFSYFRNKVVPFPATNCQCLLWMSPPRLFRLLIIILIIITIYSHPPCHRHLCSTCFQSIVYVFPTSTSQSSILMASLTFPSQSNIFSCCKSSRRISLIVEVEESSWICNLPFPSEVCHSPWPLWEAISSFLRIIRRTQTQTASSQNLLALLFFR